VKLFRGPEPEYHPRLWQVVKERPGLEGLEDQVELEEQV
jgi:hypothetical protein